MPASEQPAAAVSSNTGIAGGVGGELSGSDADEGDSVLGDSESGISSDSDDGGNGPGLSGFQDVLSSWAQAAALPKPSARRGKPGKPAAGPAAAELDTSAASVQADTSAAPRGANASAGAQPAEQRLQASPAASSSRHSPSSGSSVASWLAGAGLVGHDQGAQQRPGSRGPQAAVAAAAAATPDWLAGSGSDDEQEPQWRPSVGTTVRH